MQSKTPQEEFSRFLDIMRTVRVECPWDREQTHQSIRHSLIEEAYEVVESIDKNDLEELKEELGDLLLHVAFHAVMAEEKNNFTIDDVLRSISEKLIRRHPHVFSDVTLKTPHEVKANWEQMKMAEGRTSAVEGVPKELPALLRASRIQEKVSKVGFDWDRRDDVWNKVLEEIEELQKAESTTKKGKIEEEFGDLLFSLVNYSRFLNINPEIALRKSIEKFIKRFKKIEDGLRKKKKSIKEATLAEMDEIWDSHKKIDEKDL